MATAQQILKDPAYINANPATKQAIFDKHIAPDPAFANANEATKGAILGRFGLTPVIATAAAPEAAPDAVPQRRQYGFIEGMLPAAVQQAKELAAPVAGFAEGAATVGLGAGELIGRGLEAVGAETAGGRLRSFVAKDRASLDEAMVPFRAAATTGTGMGKLAGEIAITYPIGGFLAAPVKLAGRLIPAGTKITEALSKALTTGGFSTGVEATTTGGRVANLVTRAAGGAATGGTATALVSPDDAGTGAVIGAALPVAAAPAAAWLVNKGAKLYALLRGSAGADKARQIIKDTLGASYDKALAALRAAKPGDTARDVLARAGINADAFMALGEAVEKRDLSGFYRLQREAVIAKDRARLARLAQGGTQTEARTAQRANARNLNALTGPLRETELEAANTAGRVLPGLIEQKNRFAAAAGANVEDVRRLKEAEDIARFEATGRQSGNAPADAARVEYTLSLADLAERKAGEAADRSLLFGDVAREVDRRAASLEAYGLKPLDIDGVVSKLEQKSRAPGTRADPVQVRTLSDVAAQLRKLADDNGGIIDAEDLYQVRKTFLNDAIQKQLAAVDPKVDKKRVAELLAGIKPLIDDAIEAAGGKKWRTYLATHAAGAEENARRVLYAKALGMYQKSPNAYRELVRGDNPKVVEKIFGPGSYDIFKQMSKGSGPPAMKIMEGVSKNLERAEAIKIQAAAGQGGLERVLKKDTSNIRLPNFFSYKATVTNEVLDILQKRVSDKTLSAFEKAFKSGKNMASALDSLPVQERSQVLKLLADTKNYPASVSRAGVLATTPRNAMVEENKNRMSP
jgi:hypothetical protein